MASYHRWLDRLQVLERQLRSSSIYLLLLVLTSFVLGALCFHVGADYFSAKVTQQTDNTLVFKAKLQQQADTLAARNIELAVEKEANANMQAMFVKQQQKQQELTRELAFYRSVMAPEHSAEGVAINNLELLPEPLPGQYRLRLVLTQLQKRKRSVSGRSEVSFVGLQEGKIKTIRLADLSKTPLKFKFTYFQVLEAEFTLPDNFVLSRVIVKVIVPASRWTKGSQAEQEYSSQELLVDENEQTILLEQNTQVLDNSAQ
ncbi:hypothetical protein N9W21_01920 [Shewanella sp.]|nr:hypothetical protein [Shewanella sp.]